MWWLLGWFVGCAPPRTPLVVLAASSLVEPMQALESAYEAAHPDIDVVLAFAGSQTLARQVEEGIDAVVFVSADGDLLRDLASKNLALPPARLATNRLVLAAKGRTPSLDEIQGQTPMVVGAAEVPIGRYTVVALGELAGSMNVVSYETSVRRVTARLAAADAPLGVIYATELQTTQGRSLAGLPLPGVVDVEVAALKDQPAASELLAYLRSEQGLDVFVAHGFGRP